MTYCSLVSNRIWSNRWPCLSPQKVLVRNPSAVTLIYIFFFLDLLGQMFRNLQEIQCDVRKTNSNTELSAELEKIASSKGFVISDNEGSGNCMFYALSEQLNLVKGIKISHGELRQSIVQYLRKNPKLVSLVFYFFVSGWNNYLYYDLCFGKICSKQSDSSICVSIWIGLAVR